MSTSAPNQAGGMHVEFRDIGAVGHISFRVPRAGIAVLKGGNGKGKTTLLNAIDAAGRGIGKPPIADGAERAEVRLGEVLLRIGKRNQRTGEPEFEMLEGKYSLSDLIHPPHKSREPCDRHAIKTLAQLAGSGDISMFYDLVGGQAEFEKLVPGEAGGDLDVVALAARIERALQGKARAEEEAAAGADSKADAYSAAFRDIDVSLPHDEEQLAAARSKAERELGALEQKAKDAREKILAAREAKDALDDAENANTGPSVVDAAERLALARQAVEERVADVTHLETQLRNAREELAKAESIVRESETTLAAAQSTADTLSRFRSTVAAAQNVEEVSEQELANAREAVELARAAEMLGRDIRRAIASRDKSEEWRRIAGDHRKDADKFRQAAAGTDDVLSGLVAKLGSPLFVERGRLLMNTDRGKESFWDLSDGERAELAVAVFASAIRQRNPDRECQLTLDQRFWEGLDFDGRKRTAELMLKYDVLAWTAECSRTEDEPKELHLEIYE